MKIVFLTHCLEPGRDGVGDYTRLLASECERTGHSVRLLALNDAYVAEALRGGDFLRLGAGQPWRDRIKMARDFLDAFSPDFASLQFVCYGFHPRGIEHRLARRLEKIAGRLSMQVMFHELWIGAEKNARLKERLVGMLQRRVILDVLRRLNVRAVHTSNPAYVALLQARGIRAGRLPLFGNIPVRDAKHKTGEEWTFGFFGTLHPVWPPEPLFSHLRESCKKIVIAHVGRLGSGEVLWEKIARDYAGVFEFRRLGEQPPEKIADFFSSIDFGIATSPWELVGKSGTVAAMLEHGLPVIVNRDDVHYAGWREEEASSQLIKMDRNLLEKIRMAKRLPPRSILPDVVAQFLKEMERAL